MNPWISAGRNLFYREHPSRRHGSRPDRYWILKYRLQGRAVVEALGWSSRGLTRAKGEEIVAVLRPNWRTGAGPQTLKELRADELANRTARIRAEEKLKKAGLTLAEFWEQEVWPKWSISRTPAYAAQSAARYRRWLKPLHDDPLAGIAPADLETFILPPMLEAKLSSRTIEAVFSLFSGIWRLAQKEGLTQGPSPAGQAKRLRQDSRRERFLSREEAAALLTALKKNYPDSHDLALLALFCGLRAGECSALTWADLNFAEGTIFIKDTKNKKNRHAFMTSEVRAMLQRRLAERSASALVFPGPRSGGIRRGLSQKPFARTVRELGLNAGRTDRRQKAVFHTLRHTFASWLVIKGQPLYTVGKLLGHQRLNMTERYAHLSPESQRTAAAGLEAFFNSAPKNTERSPVAGQDRFDAKPGP